VTKVKAVRKSQGLKSLALSQNLITARLKVEARQAAIAAQVPDKIVPCPAKFELKAIRVFGCQSCGQEFTNSIGKYANKLENGKEPCPICATHNRLGSCSRAGSLMGAYGGKYQHSWHPVLNTWHASQVPARSGLKGWWRCTADEKHADWQEPVWSRTSRSGCPQCTHMSGTSKEEIAIREVLVAKHGFDPVEGKIVTPGRVWRVDALHTTKKFVVEFDGEYWHGDGFPDKRETDIRKTKELIEAGYRVLRVRHNLPNLNVRRANSMSLKHHQVFNLDNLAQRVEERVGKLLL
jgi:hypothetical protein